MQTLARFSSGAGGLRTSWNAQYGELDIVAENSCE